METQTIKVEIKLRKCTRCGHWECTGCGGSWCDNLECVCFKEHDAKCTYATEIDLEGYSRLHVEMAKLADDPTSSCLTWLKRRMETRVADDGSVTLVVSPRSA